MFAILVVAAASKLQPVDLPGVSLLSPASLKAGYLNVSAGGETGLTLRTFAIYAEHEDPNAPLIVWMNGGPGASSLMGFFTELGPYLLNGASVPTAPSTEWNLHSNAFSWSTIGSLLAWEQPAGVGFSRCIGGPCSGWVWNDTTSAAANYGVLEAFFDAHPSERARPLYIIGESYAGVYVPLLAEAVLEGNAATPSLHMKLRGVGVGNGCAGYAVDGACGPDSLDVFISVLEQGAPGVSRSALSNARAECGAQLRGGAQCAADLTAPCAAALDAVFEDVATYNQYSWGSPCGPDGDGNWGAGAAFVCGAADALSTYLLTLETQRALHVVAPNAKAPIAWEAWDGDSSFYDITAANVLPVYKSLLAANVTMLIYNGLRDTAVPAVGAREWVRSIAGAVVSPRRKWAQSTTKASSARVAGWVTTYASGARYAEVIGAGHLVPAERPEAALTLVASWIAGRDPPVYTGAKCKRLWGGRGYIDFC